MAPVRSLAAAAATIVMLTAGTGAADAGRTASLTFHAQAQSWISPQQGWLLGSRSCATGTCTTTARTADGARTWTAAGALGAALTNEEATGVTEVRFADDLHGWAFDPALWTTSDGGTTWQAQPTPGGNPVIALAANAQVAYALTSACAFGQALSDCRHGATLWRTTPGSGAWTQVALRLPVANQGLAEVVGSTAYVALATPGSGDGSTLEATTDGVRWSSRPDPCSAADGEFLAGIAPSASGRLALLCQANIGFGRAAKRVVRSTDTGLTTTDAGTLPQYGIVSRLAATPGGTLVVSSYSIGSWIYRNAGGQAWTTPEDLGDGGLGWNDITFPTDQLGFVVHGPASCCGGGPGELWKTLDGGQTWRQTMVAPAP